MENILDFSFKEFKNSLLEKGFDANRAYPVFGWVYRRSEFDFQNMTDLSKQTRSDFSEIYTILPLQEINRVVSSDRESVKFLFKTKDDLAIESVLLFSEEGDDDDEKIPNRVTVCVSSQVGCALGCNFCATGKIEYKRNLEVGEIIAQILIADSVAKDILSVPPDHKGRVVTNVVFMGMGEPFLNYDNVIKAIHILNFSGGFNLGMRHFTVSTAGISPAIIRFADDNKQSRLAISLNSANQDKRRTLMPITAKYPVDEVIKAVRDYQEKSGRRVTFEYVLIQGINDDEVDVIALKRALYNIKYSLNLIIYNPVPEIPFERPSNNEIKNFEGFLKKHGIPYVRRYSKGDEISAGCGQLGLKWSNS
jgi:23S rRNA (adenine2503-C2)-methyltransferase